MFDNLTKSISNVFSKIHGKKVLTDKDITDNLQDNRITIDELEKDSVLSVVFAEKQESGISKTGDSTEPVYPYIALAVEMCATGGLILIKTKEE